jgi:hypothetical protein
MYEVTVGYKWMGVQRIMGETFGNGWMYIILRDGLGD